ncbi:GNAT family N-acetyltransferase [Nocardioides dongkuii]|uniref:GNAT family N-acetyltransferase n=1 Tax=Nocardioides dongkuii TaxID=2760089 RepID=UPI0015F927EF|nr:GNAT family N-acetyltransferase [Nocardioides dongkuii]
MSEVQTNHNRDQQRYEAHVDGELAGFAEYVVDGDRVVFTHTEVDDRFEGQGVGSAIARAGLDDVRAQDGRSVVPRCEFIRGWIDKHPEYADLVAS